MMGMMFYGSFAPLIIAIAISAYVFAWSDRKQSRFGKVMGALLTLISIILLILQVWCASQMWRDSDHIRQDIQKMMKQMPDNSKKTNNQ